MTSFGRAPTVPESGTIETICGAATSGGPPGGIPGDAHPVTRRMTGISRRKALSPFSRAARGGASILLPFAAPTQLRLLARGARTHRFAIVLTARRAGFRVARALHAAFRTPS